jgi:hypothetical protein
MNATETQSFKNYVGRLFPDGCRVCSGAGMHGFGSVSVPVVLSVGGQATLKMFFAKCMECGNVVFFDAANVPP